MHVTSTTRQTEQPAVLEDQAVRIARELLVAKGYEVEDYSVDPRRQDGGWMVNFRYLGHLQICGGKASVSVLVPDHGQAEIFQGR
jgi:hypothetical protein